MMEGGAHVSNPVKRKRWATQRVTGNKERKKRGSILNRFHNRIGSAEKNRLSANASPNAMQEGSGASESGDRENNARRIFFNIPLPDDAKDETGQPLADFGRNKIRTAKYTPLSFVPKNLWFQFHTIANVYFLFVIILAVRASNLAWKTIMLTEGIDIPHLRRFEPSTWRRSANIYPLRDSRQRCSGGLAQNRVGQ
jgi:hypothetical protein